MSRWRGRRSDLGSGLPECDTCGLKRPCDPIENGQACAECWRRYYREKPCRTADKWE